MKIGSVGGGKKTDLNENTNISGGNSSGGFQGGGSVDLPSGGSQTGVTRPSGGNGGNGSDSPSTTIASSTGGNQAAEAPQTRVEPGTPDISNPKASSLGSRSTTGTSATTTDLDAALDRYHAIKHGRPTYDAVKPADTETDLDGTAQTAAKGSSIQDEGVTPHAAKPTICGVDGSFGINKERYSSEALTAMGDAINGRVSGPYKTNEEMWAAVFDDDGEQ